MASEQHIIVLLRYSIMVLHTYANIQMWHLSTQIVKWCPKFNFRLFFCCWWWGQWWEHIPVSWNYFTSIFSLCICPLNEVFNWFDFEETRVGGATKKQTPQSVRGPFLLFAIQSTWKTSSHFLCLNKVLTWSPRIFKPKWSEVPC